MPSDKYPKAHAATVQVAPVFLDRDCTGGAQTRASLNRVTKRWAYYSSFQ